MSTTNLALVVRREVILSLANKSDKVILIPERACFVFFWWQKSLHFFNRGPDLSTTIVALIARREVILSLAKEPNKHISMPEWASVVYSKHTCCDKNDVMIPREPGIHT